ncbi:hypothetical protein AB205_0099530 [Aquarana catesbeiana]|uniref:Uncharacterized protein n=1 Tax=Aquarana catesbeiana TaxID=8400 RepID=A0A2G9RZX7_AQUCT|nr:hypothetical protein AB205_0099530 [Aquarana catesbeiana]
MEPKVSEVREDLQSQGSQWGIESLSSPRGGTATFHIPISALKYLCAKYIFIHIGEKRIGTSEDTRDPQPPKEGEIQKQQPQDVEEGEVYEVGEIVTTTGDVDVVEEETHFTSASAYVLIWKIMVCNRDLQKIKEDINDVKKRLKNIIDVLGRI